MPDENCQSWYQYIPFLSLISGGTPMQTPLSTRLMETAVMALVGVVASYLLIIPRMEEKLSHLQTTVQEVKTDVKQIQRDLYEPKTGKELKA